MTHIMRANALIVSTDIILQVYGLCGFFFARFFFRRYESCPLNNGSFMVDGLVEKYMKTTKIFKIKSNNYFLILIKTFRWITWPKISGKWTSRIILGSLKTSLRVRAFGILNFGFQPKWLKWQLGLSSENLWNLPFGFWFPPKKFQLLLGNQKIF